MTRREIFELKYSSWTGDSEEYVRSLRLSNGSYGTPKLASAWQWFQTGFVECKLMMEIKS